MDLKQNYQQIGTVGVSDHGSISQLIRQIDNLSKSSRNLIRRRTTKQWKNCVKLQVHFSDCQMRSLLRLRETEVGDRRNPILCGNRCEHLLKEYRLIITLTPLYCCCCWACSSARTLIIVINTMK